MPNTLERESRRQVRVRDFNEWIESASDSMGALAGTVAFRCECGDRRCECAIELTRAEYEAVRAHSTRFAIVVNHESPVDTVVSEHERYAVVEKLVGRSSRHARTTYTR